ncbi:MAG: hypothetical protein ACF8NJ_06015 [Phycisphaerales bacterium JB038]
MSQNATDWIVQTPSRAIVLAALTQPLTATQLATRTDTRRDQCSKVITGLICHALTRCINACARRSRLYWVTRLGKQLRDSQRQRLGLPRAEPIPAGIDWHTYGWLCYTHRSAVVKALDRPMRPGEIKHRARFLNPEVRISASNVRDIIRLLLARDIVEPVRIRKRSRPRYILTDRGMQFRQLLIRAESEHIPFSSLERRLRQGDLSLTSA